MSSDAAHIVDLYDRHARAYDSDRKRELVIEKGWMNRFVRLLPPGASILDIGCGTGQPIARHLIEQGFKVVGIDSSPTLISLCRARFPGSEWIVADMRTLSLKRKFQGLIAWDSFSTCPMSTNAGCSPSSESIRRRVQCSCLRAGRITARQ